MSPGISVQAEKYKKRGDYSYHLPLGIARDLRVDNKQQFHAHYCMLGHALRGESLFIILTRIKLAISVDRTINERFTMYCTLFRTMR